MLNGALRSDEPANWSRLCAYCHMAAHGERVIVNGKPAPKMSLANLLFLKAIHDPDNYNHAALSELRPMPAPEEPG